MGGLPHMRRNHYLLHIAVHNRPTRDLRLCKTKTKYVRTHETLKEMRAIMATTTTPIGYTAEATSTAPGKPGFFARFLEKIVQARIRRAELEVKPILARLSDDRLRDLGFTGEDIEKMREKHYVQAVYWS